MTIAEQFDKVKTAETALRSKANKSRRNERRAKRANMILDQVEGWMTMARIGKFERLALQEILEGKHLKK